MKNCLQLESKLRYEYLVQYIYIYNQIYPLFKVTETLGRAFWEHKRAAQLNIEQRILRE